MRLRLFRCDNEREKYLVFDKIGRLIQPYHTTHIQKGKIWTDFYLIRSGFIIVKLTPKGAKTFIYDEASMCDREISKDELSDHIRAVALIEW